MYCPKCKKEMPDGMKFCGVCGTPLVDPPKKKKKKKGFWTGLLCGLLIMAVIGGILQLIFLFRGDRVSGYDTPEEAAEAYFKAAKKGNPEAMIDTFAMEPYVENYDLEAQCDHLGIYSFNTPQLFPNENDYLTGLNLEKRRSCILTSLATMYLNLCLPDQEGKPVAFDGKPYNTPQELIEDLKKEDFEKNRKHLEVLEIQSIEYYIPKIDHLEEGRDIIKENNKKVLHCEDSTELMVKFSFGGETWYQDMSLVSYDGEWYLHQLGGIITNILAVSPMRMGLISEAELQDAIES